MLMQPIPNVRTQVGLLWLAVAAAAVVRGSAVGIVLLVICGCGALATLVFAVPYLGARRRRVDAFDGSFDTKHETAAVSARRIADDRVMAGLCVLAFGVPAAIAGAMVAGWWFDGMAFPTTAASVAFELPVVAFAAIVVSSAIDWYLITPFQRGVMNRPICQADDDPGLQARRARTQWWLVHRGICELVGYLAASLVLAILFSALANLVQDDRTLGTAVGSFIGAGTAFFVAGYMGRRTIPAWEYMQAQPVGLGCWASGKDALGEGVEGFVVDVAIRPGVQILPRPEGPSSHVEIADLMSSKVASRLQTQKKPAGVPCAPGTCRRWVAQCDRQYRLKTAPADQPPQALPVAAPSDGDTAA